MKLFIATLLLLLVSTQAHGAITESGAGTQRNGIAGNSADDSLPLAFPGNVTANCLLGVGGAIYTVGADSAPIVVTDSVGTTYTVESAYNGINVTVFLAQGRAPSSGANTVTVNPDGGGSYISFGIDEFCGQDTVSQPDVDGGSSSGTSTAPSDDITTVTADSLILGVATHSGASAFTPDVNYTEIAENEDNGCCQAFSFVFRIVTTAQAYSVSWTTDSVTWLVYTLAFDPTPAAATRRLFGPTFY